MPEIDTLANPDPAIRRLIVGCGYLGRRVAARWLLRGRRVLTTTRGREDHLRSLGLTPIRADVLNSHSLESLPLCETVVYSVGFDRASNQSMHDVYVRGLENVLHALPRSTKFIYVSSTGVYGDADGDWVDETTTPAPNDESGRIVLEAEQLLRREWPEAIVLRFAGIYGPGRLLGRMEALRRGEPIAADPENWLNLAQVEDGAAAVVAADDRGRPGETLNICDDLPVQRGEFYAKLAELLGAPPPAFVAAAGRRHRGNRRVSNRKMHERLEVRLQYPSFREGLPAAVAETGPN
jgi:nucleoside-diphosphate-sugar epimerase